MNHCHFCQDLYIDAGTTDTSPVSPSAIPNDALGGNPNALTDGQLRAAVTAYQQKALQAWERRVMQQLDALHTTRTGAAVIDRLASGCRRTGRDVTIEPKGRGDNMFRNLYLTSQKDYSLDKPGTLHGRLQYEPEPRRSSGFVMGADEVLIHELVHACRWANLAYTGESLRWMGYEDMEEFAAILIGNVYSSEWYKSSKLRSFIYRAEGDAEALDQRLSTSEGFLGKIEYFNMRPRLQKGPLDSLQRTHVELVAKLFRDDAPLCEAVAEADVRFNPLRLFRDRRRQYEAVL
jgi:hypothetical protein